MAKKTESRFSWYPWALAIGLGAAFGLGISWTQLKTAWEGGPTSQHDTSELSSQLSGLIDQHGAKFDGQSLQGRYALVYFGFTLCPDACPTALFALSTVLKKLDADAKRIQPIFVSVDPERDTPAVLANYLAPFGPRFIGLTGEAQAVRQAIDAFGVIAVKSPNDKFPNGYTMDHSNEFLLLSPDGALLTRLPANLGADTLEKELSAALKADIAKRAS